MSVIGRASAVAALLLAGPPAWAHRPYEHVERVLRGPSGAEVTLVFSYVDGIIGSDPVKLVVRDSHGGTVAETAFVRDVSLVCPSTENCLAFLFDDNPLLVPQQVLRLSGTSLVKADEAWLYPVGVVAHVGRHWLGYLAGVACLLLPVAVLARTWRMRPGVARGLLLVVSGGTGLLIYAVWLWGILMSELSFLMTVSLAAVVVVADARYRRRKGSRLGVPLRGEVGGPTSASS